jgi:hypothetical protein
MYEINLYVFSQQQIHISPVPDLQRKFGIGIGERFVSGKLSFVFLKFHLDGIPILINNLLVCLDNLQF